MGEHNFLSVYPSGVTSVADAESLGCASTGKADENVD
jgi:hypothetical protein